MQQIVTVHLDKKTILLKFLEFDAEVDMDDLTKIHYDNIYGELVTISSLLNKVGQLKADITNRYAEEKIEFDVWEAGLRKLTKTNKISNGEKFNIQDIDDIVTCDPGYKVRKKNLVSIQKQVDSIDALYWAVKSKDDKLTNLRSSITPKDFETEVVEGVINAMMISKRDNVVGKVKEKTIIPNVPKEERANVRENDNKVVDDNGREIEVESKNEAIRDKIEKMRNKLQNKASK
jgi:hypothetical protein